MAYAAITQTLKTDVSGKIDRMKIAEMNTMRCPDTLMSEIIASVELRDHAVALMWALTEPDLRPRLEKYNQTARIKIRFFVPAEFSQDGQTSREVDTALVSTTTVPCTVQAEAGYNASTRLPVMVDFTALPLFAEYAEAFKNRLECVSRWGAVASQVKTFLESCKSVNEALKLWPDVARYLPKQTLDKINEKPTKQAKDITSALAALRAIDMDQVNTSNVLARMAGAPI